MANQPESAFAIHVQTAKNHDNDRIHEFACLETGEPLLKPAPIQVSRPAPSQAHHAYHAYPCQGGARNKGIHSHTPRLNQKPQW